MGKQPSLVQNLRWTKIVAAKFCKFESVSSRIYSWFPYKINVWLGGMLNVGAKFRFITVCWSFSKIFSPFKESPAIFSCSLLFFRMDQDTGSTINTSLMQLQVAPPPPK
jgi:hypothetical protein